VAKDQKDNEMEDYAAYYGVPFKSYDEILEARRRAGRRRKGYLVLGLLVAVILCAGVFIGLFSGNLLVKRVLAGMNSQTAEKSSSAEEPAAKESEGFSLQLQESNASAQPLVTTYDVSAVVAQAQKSVVGIVSESYSSFSSSETGSGIIMSPDGYIVTNNHVISDGGSITVVLSDGANCPAYLIGTDEQTDIAVLKITGGDLPAAVFGDSDTLQIGEPAIAIGNPGGLQLQGTVTAGIISATDRRMTVDNNVMDLIQTDASINPGNSGGPLLNKYGQVVGVTSIKITSSGFEGLGFAIPINTVKPIVEELVKNGYVSGRPLVGVTVRTISPLAASFYNLPSGLFVDTVMPMSAAAKAGLESSDIITAIDGTPVRSVSEACAARNAHKAGDSVTLSYYRGGQTFDLTFQLDEQTADNKGYDF